MAAPDAADTPSEADAPLPPPPPPLSVTVRAGGSYEEAAALRSRFVLDALVDCTVDARSGEVRSVRDNATAAHLAARIQAPPASAPGTRPLALLLVDAVWTSLLDTRGAAPRPLPRWLARLCWLPWARCCAPGLPLLLLASLSAAARLLQQRSKDSLGHVWGAAIVLCCAACAWHADARMACIAQR